MTSRPGITSRYPGSTTAQFYEKGRVKDYPKGVASLQTKTTEKNIPITKWNGTNTPPHKVALRFRRPQEPAEEATNTFFGQREYFYHVIPPRRGDRKERKDSKDRKDRKGSKGTKDRKDRNKRKERQERKKKKVRK